MASKKIITQQLVEHLALLSRLELKSSQLVLFEQQLEEILEYVAAINEVKTGKKAATQAIAGLTDVLRADVAKNSDCLPSNEALKNAPSKQDGYFKVKALFE